MRVCSGPGCLRAIDEAERYCDACRPAVSIDTVREHGTGYTAELDRLRKSQRWRNLRAKVLRTQPLCARCRSRRAGICDHIVPAQIAVAEVSASGLNVGRWEGYFLRGNLQGLCVQCHALKTIEDKGHTGTWPSVLQHLIPRTTTF